ncbi:MAG TPA: hypothetical protein VFI68_03760, partial [Anaerolineales bacterium]|nr:hypothetical protein [Anaerolineales bacterium]
VHFRRKTGKYEVEQLYTQYSLKKLVEKCDLKITCQSDVDFDSFIMRRDWLKNFVGISIIRTFAYFIYKQHMSTIEAILS